MVIKLSELPAEDRLILSDPSRQLPIWGTINESLIGKIIPESLEGLTKLKEQRKVFLNIHSPGGHEGCITALYAFLKLNNIEVGTIVSGDAYSAGFFAFMLGEKTRYIYSTSSLMIHETQFEFGKQLKSESWLKERVRSAAVITDEWYEMIMKRINWKDGFDSFRAKFSDDRFLTPQEAIDYGFATAIVDPFS